MKEIQTREDVHKLVIAFYAKIRKDELLGPIFNRIIPEENWDKHLDKLTDFWETALFGIPKFKGNPTLAHRKVDQVSNPGINEQHFNYWLNLWHETIDEQFTGSKADRAKQAAIGMASAQLAAIKFNRDCAGA